jgi:Rieske Fe-S protein
MILNSGLLLGGLCVCPKARGVSGPRSTCCSTPDLERESLVIEEKGLTIDLTKAPSLATIGSAAYIINAEKSLQIIVVRTGKKEYLALSRLCTHASQVISYNRKRGVLQCNGFNHSIFDLSGQVVKGPAATPLKSYPVTLMDGKLEIAL